MAENVFHDLTLASQRQFAGIRRKVQFFSTFAGGVIEALRELGFRLSNIEKQSSFRGHGRQQGLGQAATTAPNDQNMELYFEQRDNDQCRVLIVPYRTDLPYLCKGRFTAQLGLELSRYTSNPDVLRQAMNVNYQARKGGFLGGLAGKTIPKLVLNSPPDIKQPGSMTFELRGARLVVSMNTLVDLSKFRLSDFDLDVESIKADMEAYFYGLEKYLALLLKNFGSGVTISQEKVASSAPTEDSEDAAVDGAAPSPPSAPSSPPPAPTVPLATAQTINLSAAQLPSTLADLEVPRRPRPIPESDRDEPSVGEPLRDISLPFDVSDADKSKPGQE